MGLLGLRKFIDSCGCTRLLPVPLSKDEMEEQTTRRRAHDDGTADPAGRTPATVDHVLIDMNCIIHSCCDKENLATKSRREIMLAVIERVKLLVTQVIEPRKSLTICIDGPAPIAKLQTQRLRRRKVSLISEAERRDVSQNLSSLDITAGSLFLVELENLLAETFRCNDGRGFLTHDCAVFLHGSTVPGEGEAKVSRALSFLAGNISEEDAANPSLRRLTVYNPDDEVAVLGNDIDLVLTCIGATFYHNISVISPSSLQLINVGDILYRWLISSSTVGGDGTAITIPQLPSVRVDFAFLFLLNGGDFYVGVGEVAPQLWRRYRTLRSSHPTRSLVSADLCSIDVHYLVDILGAQEYTGEASHKVGMDLLQSALWSLYSVVTGVCPDYRYIPPSGSPTLSHLKAAALHCKRKGKPIRLNFVENSVPLSPLETYVALMPSESALPRSISTTLRSAAKHRLLSSKLLESNDILQIADAATDAVSVSAAHLTPSESFLREFTSPVYLNYNPPAKRQSRYEQHRQAKKGLTKPESVAPVVLRITIPPYFDYVHFGYSLTKLKFVDSYTALLDGGTPPKDGGARVVGLPSQTKNHSKSKKINQLLELAKTLGDSEVREKRKRDADQTDREIKRIKRRINRLQQKETKGLLQSEVEAGGDDSPVDDAFISMLQQFVGDPAVVTKLLSDADNND
ncbi:hypothetical protein AGDE_14143 [Angomonas deanei]|uniref:XRN 5'-3' exonuclease N-terminus, putative n=1 Tax=Angomonas deanei TaxID=59799 RepID=A0A7G2BYZ5_9TRYP|nr:hypothetical protein AGDE_14143 [Angomonas deanei]CAD2212680.1 XRN 5'-3' exonuclease N-terminus, putative [Angomonas deanei]|eukprot:EPY21303.1 hypothetical protein AGDE_14143 [Angomonas deanei]